ncbi:MAG TPA: YfiR family protein, partial [Candidatus Baltobacteraceae bacterium]|nr:YfiR family protein [Candidatus Baltobacteraceae bacterium]
GICGESKLTETLKILVAGKSIGNHTIAVRQIEESDDFTQCHILFISDSAAARMPGILEKAAALPILTVGENDAFARYGGIINFVLKNGNVRLEIDLAAARKAGLTISSRLLAVADVVKGKSN